VGPVEIETKTSHQEERWCDTAACCLITVRGVSVGGRGEGGRRSDEEAEKEGRERKRWEPSFWLASFSVYAAVPTAE
jgi:hypothetical protein